MACKNLGQSPACSRLQNHKRSRYTPTQVNALKAIFKLLGESSFNISRVGGGGGGNEDVETQSWKF